MARLNTNLQRRSRPRPAGIALIELAILLPLLLIITFGVIEFGWMFTKTAEITNAARHGARVGVRPGATSASVQADITTFMNAAGLGTSGYSVALSPADVAGLAPGQTFTVTVTVPYANVNLTGFPLIPTPANLQAKVTMAKEGPPSSS
jgi:Flp pilus assembly protein TadG